MAHKQENILTPGKNFPINDSIRQRTPKRPPTPSMSKTLREYNRIFKAMNEVYRDAALKLGLSNSAFDILYAIYELGDDCLQRDICQTTFIPKQTIHSSIRNLEQEGYLLLTPGRGRSMHINLTAKGQELLESTIYPMVELEDQAFSCMTPEERQQMLRLNTAYIAALREGVDQFHTQTPNERL